MSPRPLLPFIAPLLLCAACDAWPRYADLPDGSDIVEEGTDPASLVEVAWSSLAEADLLVRDGADNGETVNVVSQSLDSLTGLHVVGGLRGVGWNSAFEPIMVDAGECGQAVRDPGQQGDWAGDVDVVVVEIGTAEAPVLCVTAAFQAQDLGLDLMLYELDGCGLPGPPLRDGDGDDAPILGVSRAGGTTGWHRPVESGKRYAVLLAGYDAPDALETYPYDLGVSVIPGHGGLEICPALPVEAR